mgnify:CR=1 FL=1
MGVVKPWTTGLFWFFSVDADRCENVVRYFCNRFFFQVDRRQKFGSNMETGRIFHDFRLMFQNLVGILDLGNIVGHAISNNLWSNR